MTRLSLGDGFFWPFSDKDNFLNFHFIWQQALWVRERKCFPRVRAPLLQRHLWSKNMCCTKFIMSLLKELSNLLIFLSIILLLHPVRMCETQCWEEPKEESGAAANWPLLRSLQEPNNRCFCFDSLLSPWATDPRPCLPGLLVIPAPAEKTEQCLTLQLNKGGKKILYQTCANGHLAPCPTVSMIWKVSSQGLSRDGVGRLLCWWRIWLPPGTLVPPSWRLACLSSRNCMDRRLYKAENKTIKILTDRHENVL